MENISLFHLIPRHQNEIYHRYFYLHCVDNPNYIYKKPNRAYIFVEIHIDSYGIKYTLVLPYK